MFVRFRQYFFFSLNFIRREKTANFFQLVLFSIYSYFIYLGFSFFHLSAKINGSLETTFYRLGWILFFSLIISLIGLNLLKLQRKVSDIGIMQAFGATKFQVLLLLLFENSLLLSFSTLIGVILGILLLGNGDVFLKDGATNNISQIIQYFFATLFIVNLLSFISVGPAVYILSSQDPFQSIRRGR